MATTVTGTTSKNAQTDQNHVWQRLTIHLRHALLTAEHFAAELRANSIDPIHILYGLVLESGSIAHETMKAQGISPEGVRSMANQFGGSHATEGQKPIQRSSPPASQSVKTYLLHAAQRARSLRHAHIGTEHLLVELLEHEPELLRRLINTSQYLSLRKHVLTYLEGTRKLSDAAESIQLSLVKDESTNQPSILQAIGTDLTELARQGILDSVEGRQEEILTCLSILARKTKNTPLLVGPAGVGKTAIVEGIAHRIVAGTVPPLFRNRRLVSLDLSALVAGTGYRGEFEHRMRQLLEELRADPSLIVFIDEFHTIVGTGNAPSGLDIANLLKPALARGQIALLGATTPDEYREVIEKDAALERRVQPVFVRESTHEETRAILHTLRKRFEIFHSVSIDASLFDDIIALCDRYLPDRHFPDKAIDVLDQACGTVVTRSFPSASPFGTPAQAPSHEQSLQELEIALEKAVDQEQYDRAQDLDHKVTILSAQVTREKEAKRLKERAGMTASPTRVTSQDLRDTVARIIGVTPDQITLLSDPAHINNLSSQLKSHVFGQDHIIDAIAPILSRAGLGLTDKRHPLASLLFVGPSGSGKTHLAEAIASTFFSTEKAFLRLDMSEFNERFTVSRLIGAPAGYVGYDEGGKLTEYVRRHPFGVILFDEIDKAHPEVLNLLLQILDSATLTDSAGRLVTFRHSIIILTANLRDGQGQKTMIGYGEEAPSISRSDLERQFRPELLNRIDLISIFSPLDIAAMTRIAETVLADRIASWKKAGIDVTLEPSLIPLFTESVPQTSLGARSIERAVAQQLEPHVLGAILRGRKRLTVRQRSGRITTLPPTSP